MRLSDDHHVLEEAPIDRFNKLVVDEETKGEVTLSLEAVVQSAHQ